jgi:hypothetical protein
MRTAVVLGGIVCALGGCFCAGECSGSPNDLKVTFNAGVSRAAADSVLRSCGSDPIVRRISGLQTRHGRLIGMLRTKVRPGEPATQVLMKCLLSSPQVSGIGRAM